MAEGHLVAFTEVPVVGTPRKQFVVLPGHGSGLTGDLITQTLVERRGPGTFGGFQKVFGERDSSLLWL